MVCDGLDNSGIQHIQINSRKKFIKSCYEQIDGTDVLTISVSDSELKICPLRHQVHKAIAIIGEYFVALWELVIGNLPTKTLSPQGTCNNRRILCVLCGFVGN